MSTVKDYLKDDIEKTPQWLMDFKPGDKIDANRLFESRIVYYPGSRFDGQPIRTFNSAHYAHIFINVDYLVTREETMAEFKREDCCKGYTLLDIQDIPENELTPNGWHPTVFVDPERAMSFVHEDNTPYCLAAVFERMPEFDDSHGAERFVVPQLCADGIAGYDALFANRHRAPDVLLIQDHGFGCNYASFGRNSILEEIARKSHTFPKYICVEEDNEWHRYSKIENLEPELGGMWANHRYLFEFDI